MTSKFSGGEKYTVDLLAAMKLRGWDVAVVGGDNYLLQAACVSHGIRYIHSALGPKLGKKTALRTVMTWGKQQRELKVILEREGADFVLLQYKLEQLLWAGSPIDSKVIMLEHGPIPGWILRIRPLLKKYVSALKVSSARIAASAPALNDLESLGFSGSIIEAGIDDARLSRALERKPATRAKLIERFGTKRVAIYAGRVTVAKGVILAAGTIARLDEVAFLVAGVGPAEKELNRIAARNKNIVSLGHLDEPYELMAAADVGVLLTTDPGEGRPLFALECIALGVPVVGLERSAAMRSLKSEFEEGVILLPDASESRLREAIAKAALHKPQSRNWSEAAAELDKLLAPNNGHEVE